MALNAYLSLSGVKTGEVRGSVTQKHQPLVITKQYQQIPWTWVDGALVGQDDLRGQP